MTEPTLENADGADESNLKEFYTSVGNYLIGTDKRNKNKKPGFFFSKMQGFSPLMLEGVSSILLCVCHCILSLM